MVSKSKRVQSIVELLVAWQIENIVFSPGSRNAPVVLSLANDNRFSCISIVDERSAGFYALGIALKNKKPVVLCCTSGSASLNYASAISEAYYQGVPLLVLTTDRPPEWINHGEGQSINQVELYKNYAYSSYNLPVGETEDDVWFAQRQINEAIIDVTTKSLPVQINVPFREPFYDTEESTTIAVKKIDKLTLESALSTQDLKVLATKFNTKNKIMILAGQMPKDDKLNYILGELSVCERVVVLTESTANLSNRNFFSCIDRVLTAVIGDEVSDFTPDLIITIGNAIVSKKIKAFLRITKNAEHWSLDKSERTKDVFKKLTMHLPIDATSFFRELSHFIDYKKQGEYKQKWLAKHLITQTNHEDYLKSSPWSDLKVFDVLYNTLPEFINLHLGNSSPIRYMQLFNQIASVTYYANRGVSGIDGCTSTACGVALADASKMNVVISGDLSFFYDSNAFWNNYLPPNLRVIVINNSGGGIFRIIPGPSKTNVLEDFFEVGNTASIQGVAQTHNLNYFVAHSVDELEQVLSPFYNEQENKRPAILEIVTPKTVNAEVLKEYFGFLDS